MRHTRERLSPRTIPATEPHFRDPQGATTEDPVGKSFVPLEGSHEWRDRKHRVNERLRIVANWDPSYQAEKVDWYTEFIHRTADTHISWFEQPQKQPGGMKLPLEIQGMGIHHIPGIDEASITVAPLEDGSVCLWDAKGNIIGRGAEGSLRGTGSENSAVGIVNGVSVDSEKSRAFIAVHQGECF